MSRLRIGLQIEPNDSFWVQVQEAVYHASENLPGLELIPIEIRDPLTTRPLDEQGGLVEELLTYDLRALICKDILPVQLAAILNQKLPVVYLAETDYKHPLLTSPWGLYEAARLAGSYLAEQLERVGHILCVGGLTEPNADDGSSRLAGFWDAVGQYPDLSARHIPTVWSYSGAREQVAADMAHVTEQVDAIFGLSDTVALAARDVVDEMGLSDHQLKVAGINGDPLALAAISEGKMTLTVETPASELGEKATILAYKATQGETLPAHFSYQPHLITLDNVNTVALQKLVAIAEIPSRMIGVNRQQEQNRLVQLETSAEINRQVGRLLDRQELLREISNLIRSNYGYDDVQVFFWSKAEQCFVLTLPEDARHQSQKLSLDSEGVLGEVIRCNAPIFIPDAHASERFPPEPQWPRTHSRVVLPIQLGSALIGILDLHSHRPALHPRHELIGLQSLANQLGIVLKNAELYADALEAKARAEKADQLKTRLLANVSHELRTPLNVIIGYAQTALASPNPYHLEMPPALQKDLRYICQSGQHLLHLINDLLCLSQAEIGALEIFRETIHTRLFLEDVYNTMADIVDTPHITWQLCLSDELPLIEADPVRLRQILLNLLHNASKFTREGQIELGAEVMLPYLHLWVRDTGVGIPTEMQEQIFEPFVTLEQRQIGVGLGLTIARRLIVLHGGSLTLESRPQRGSTFHIYLPLSDLAGRSIAVPQESAEPVLLLVSTAENPTPAITALCKRQNLSIYRLGLGDDLSAILKKTRPAGLAWDLTSARPDEWKLFERLRAHPQLCQLPLIVYGQEQDAASGMTNVLMKPVSDKTILGTLMALCPAEEQRPVLIVDDDPDARALYQRLTEQALPGHPVRAAENGAQALAVMERETPGLVILDLMMPEVDGFAVLDKMRSSAKTRRVPVVVMSGHLLSPEDVHRLDYGYVVFHSKSLLSHEETVEALQMTVSDKPLAQPTSRLVKQALAFIHQNYDRATLSREDIANEIGTSETHLDRIFRKEVGLSPIECLNRFRIQQAKELLAGTSDDVTRIAFQVGFNDSAYFSRVFKKLVGQAPSTYRQRA